MRVTRALAAMALLLTLVGCSDIGQPFNTPNSEPVCIAAAGLAARVDDLQALDPATATAEQYRQAAYGVSGAAQTLVAQARVLADSEAGQVEDSFRALQNAAQELPPGTTPSDAKTALADEVDAAEAALISLNTKISCPPFPTPAPG